jgi:uncharacterized membrane protein
VNSVTSMHGTRPGHLRGSAEQPLYSVLAGAASVLVLMLLMMAACSRPLTVVAAQPVPELTRQSEVIQRELAARNEHELRVRVVNVTQRILEGGKTVDADDAAVIEAEVEAINALLDTFELPPLAPALRFDRGSGRLVW